MPSGDVALLPAEGRLHETRIALDGGGDGLDILRWVLAETSEREAGAVAASAEHGLNRRLASSEDPGAAVITGTAVSS